MINKIYTNTRINIKILRISLSAQLGDYYYVLVGETRVRKWHLTLEWVLNLEPLQLQSNVVTLLHDDFLIRNIAKNSKNKQNNPNGLQY